MIDYLMYDYPYAPQPFYAELTYKEWHLFGDAATQFVTKPPSTFTSAKYCR